jgi:hypothetical protein
MSNHDRIAARAYSHYAARGYQHGHHLADWFAAEAEIRAEDAAPAQGTMVTRKPAAATTTRAAKRSSR